MDKRLTDRQADFETDRQTETHTRTEMAGLRDGQRLTDWWAKRWTDRRASCLRFRQTGGLTERLEDRGAENEQTGGQTVRTKMA